MVVNSERKRKTWTRSKRGCKTCRVRHVKCDETYPACKRCSSIGRICDGCGRPNEWEVVTLSSISTTSPERRPSPVRHNDDAACFAFFQYQTIDYLTGLLDQHWKPFVLRVAEQNDAIYHAALAIGSIHKTILSKKQLITTFDEDKYAIKQYTRSLRKLALGLDNGHAISVDVMLSACILFIGFESLRRNYGVVVDHIRSGIRILQQHYGDSIYKNDDKRLVPLRQLVPAFARLERQLQEIVGDRTHLVQTLAAEQAAAGFWEHHSSPHPQQVPQFSDLDDAWMSLHQRFHVLISWSGEIHQDWFNHLGDVYRDSIPRGWVDYLCSTELLERLILESRHNFDLWSRGLEELRKRLGDMTARDESIYALLQCHAMLANNIIDAAQLHQPWLWDNFRDRYERIVALCRVVIKHETGAHAQPIIQQRYVRTNSSKQERGPLTFDMSVSMILLHVIGRCRDARIRLDAIKLLEDYPRIEGLWDSAVLAQVGRSIDSVERQGGVSLEEAAAKGALAAEIPSVRRVVALRGVPHGNSRTADLMLYTGHSKEPACFVLNW